METLHPLLKRQLKKHLKIREIDKIPEHLHSFINAVNDAYIQSDEDRKMLERSLELSSDELLTANKRLRENIERLKELDKAKSAFLSSVSHELRTPLTSILGFAKLIEKDFKKHFEPLAQDDKKLSKKAKRIVENLEIIVKEGERLTRLINDVLDIAKIESGRIQWKESKFNLKELLEDVVASVLGQFNQKENVDLIVDLPDNLPELYMDRDRIHQVFLNLLNNAAKFTEKGYVKLYAYNKNNSVVVAVEDTGIGIPKEDLDKIFDTFHQVVHEDTLKDKPQGTGLGLAISKQIVEHYKGKIWVVSEVGKGSTFFVEFPVNTVNNGNDINETNKTEVKEKEPTRAKENEKLILIVDDDASIRELLSQFLINLGFKTITAKDGQEAIEKVKKYKPDLITMDLMMPVMDGKTAIKKIKEDPYLKNIPILVISVLPERDNIADAYIEKPINEEHLKEIINSLLKEEKEYKRECLVVGEDKDEIIQKINGNMCFSNALKCEENELQEKIKEGFKGVIIISSDVAKKLDVNELIKNKDLQVIIV